MTRAGGTDPAPSRAPSPTGTGRGTSAYPPPRTAPFTELDARRLGPVRRYFHRHPAAMDWLIVAVAGVPCIPYFVATGDLSAMELAASLVGSLLLLLRRRRPFIMIAALCLLTLVTVVTIGSLLNYDLVFVCAVYAVASLRPPLQAWVSWAVVVAVCCLAFSLTGDPPDGSTPIVSTTVTSTSSGASSQSVLPAASLVLFLVLSLIAIAVGFSVRARRVHIADLVDSANALARERDQQGQLAAAYERTRIAREMHDVVAHSLTVMITLADGARATPDKRLADRALDELTTTGRAALTDMRRVLGVLRGDDEAPLLPYDQDSTLEEVVGPFRTAGLPVRIVRTGRAIALPSDLQHTAHRIVTEALTNVLRYAPLAPVVEVHIRERQDGDDRWLDLRVVNTAGRSTGAGPSASGSGNGIIGMKERAAMYAGTVTAGPTVTGWEVNASIPIPHDEADADDTGAWSRPW